MRSPPNAGWPPWSASVSSRCFAPSTTPFTPIGNIDPFSGAAVLSRGIVGDRGGEPTVASPLHKQVFSLASGRCLDDPAVAVPTYPVRLNDGHRRSDGRCSVTNSGS